jgi:hypothetical protein
MSSHVVNYHQFFHGTDKDFAPGDVIKPHVDGTWADDPRAFATDWDKDAEGYAAQKSFDNPNDYGGQGKLFGSVYEVEPMTPGDPATTIPSPSGFKGHIADPKGLKVKRHAAFVSHFALGQGVDPSHTVTKTD